MTREKDDASFRVIDRRMFTEEGELRPEAQEQVRREHEEPVKVMGTPAAPVAQASATAQQTSSAGGTAGGPAMGTAAAGASLMGGAAGPAAGLSGGAPAADAPARSPHFEMLLNLVANQAAAMLGAYADPQTGQAMLDLEGAREFIDMLDALREKTRGNLAEVEDRMLTEVLGSLKFTYMEMTKAADKARAGGAGPAKMPRR